jgi:hypothetical protein
MEDEGNVSVEIARLARLGRTDEEIASELRIPVERIARSRAGTTDAAPRAGETSLEDETVADSLPASDPPPSPLA